MSYIEKQVSWAEWFHTPHDQNYIFLMARLIFNYFWISAPNSVPSVFNELSVEDITETNPGAIISTGFPFYYPVGVTTVWIVTFTASQYANVIFSYISLNQYEVNTKGDRKEPGPPRYFTNYFT